MTIQICVYLKNEYNLGYSEGSKLLHDLAAKIKAREGNTAKLHYVLVNPSIRNEMVFRVLFLGTGFSYSIEQNLTKRAIYTKYPYAVTDRKKRADKFKSRKTRVRYIKLKSSRTK